MQLPHVDGTNIPQSQKRDGKQWPTNSYCFLSLRHFFFVSARLILSFSCEQASEGFRFNLVDTR